MKIALKSFELVPPNAALVVFTDDQPVVVVLAFNQVPAEEGKDLI